MAEDRRHAAARLLLAFLLAGIAWVWPWRLTALATEAWFLAPGPVRLTGSDQGYWTAQRLTLRLHDLGYTVIYVSLPHGILGQTDPQARTVEIAERLHWSDRASVLAHEGGHILAPGWIQGPATEVFAEAVSYLALKDGLREHARYLAADPALTTLTLLTAWGPISHAAALLRD